MKFTCGLCGGELNTGGACVECDLMHTASHMHDQRQEHRIHELEQQVAELQRFRDAVEWLEAFPQVHGSVSVCGRGEGVWLAWASGGKPSPFGPTLIEAIESLRQQVEEQG